MRALFANPVYARAFAAQIVALIGTGLLTVALGLLAYELAGGRAGLVLGAAYFIKMVAYVGLSPVSAAIVARLPRRAVLVGCDLLRAIVALGLPFVDEIWQIYVLIFVLQAASATFTPAYQALLPDILPDEEEYTQALSLSRLAYDLENLFSPLLAAALLTVISFHSLFVATAAGFVASAILIGGAVLPHRQETEAPRPFRERLTRGIRIYLATPRLRGLLALNLTAAATGAMVIVNTVVIVRDRFGLGEAEVAHAMAAFGAGSMVSAITIPGLLKRVSDRALMLTGGFALAVLTGLAAVLPLTSWPLFLALWAGFGLSYSAILTPGGRLLRRSSHASDRPALFAAQFALSHLCWLITYPLSGWAATTFGLAATMGILGAIGLAGAILAALLWPGEAAAKLEHSHDDLPPDHPHLRDHPPHGHRHTHRFVIDDMHRHWPR